ncbi:TIGR03621 family F420-dependent LLM class oxidoreductase [Actinomadura harenae]|nr:TIGR03621 family F420-dependent LLM class oxidoreductase [Actinomadura harenae]
MFKQQDFSPVVRFGAVLRTATSLRDLVDRAQWLEDAGFGTALMSDHLAGERLAPMPALAAIASATTRLRLGTLVLANDFRHPAVLAREASTLDLLSGGRFELGLGAGWRAEEYQAAGLGFDRPGVRIDRLAEAVTVMRELWRGGSCAFGGRYYQLDGLEMAMPCARPGRARPDLLIGGGGPRLLRLAARHADTVAFTRRANRGGSGPFPGDTTMGALRRKVSLVHDAAGARTAQLELAMSLVRIKESIPDDLNAEAFVLGGDVAAMVDQVLQRIDLGVSYFLLHRQDDLARFAPVVAELSGARGRRAFDAG